MGGRNKGLNGKELELVEIRNTNDIFKNLVKEGFFKIRKCSIDTHWIIC